MSKASRVSPPVTLAWLCVLFLVGLASQDAPAAMALTFHPGDVYWTPNDTGVGVYNVTAGGGPSFPELATTDNSYGQFAWSLDRSTMYLSDWDSSIVVKITPTGTVTTFASFASVTGLLMTTTGNLLAADYSHGTIYDITAGGPGTAVVTGVGNPRNMIQLANGHILVADQGGGQVFDLNYPSGPATAFATGFQCPASLAQFNGRIMVAAFCGATNGVYDITAGGDFSNATPYAAGSYISLTVDGQGRLLANAVSGTQIFDISAGGSGTLFATLPAQGDSGLGTVPGAVVAQPPTISPSPAPSVAPFGSIPFTCSAGASSSWSLTAGPSPADSGAQISTNGGSATFTAGSGSTTGATNDTITCTDTSSGLSTSETITVTTALTVASVPTSIYPGGTTALTASNGSGSISTWQISPDNTGASIVNPAGMTATYQAGNNVGSTQKTDTVVVTDGNGAIATVTITVTPGITISASATSTPPMGTVTLTGSGGDDGPYKWSFASPGDNQSGASLNPASPLTGASTTYTAGSAGGKTDTITAADSHGNTATIQIGVGNAVSIAASPTGTVGPGEPVSLTGSGGNGPPYAWSFAVAGDNKSGANLNPASGASTTYTPGIAGGVAGASDKVTAVDSLGNTNSITITVGPILTISPTSTTTAPQGKVPFSAAGGWSSGSGCNGYSWSVRAAPTGGSNGPSVDSSGNYTAGTNGSTSVNVSDIVRVTDCADNFAEATVTVTPGVGITASPSSTTWPNGTVTLTAAGGTGTFTKWQFVGSTGSGSPSLNGSGASVTYKAGTTANSQDTVQVTDSNNNIATITLDVGPGVSITSSNGNSTPPKGSLQFSASGGSGSFTWNVSLNGSGNAMGQPSVIPSTSTTGGMVTYTAGAKGSSSDTVTVTDSSGNTASVSISVGGGIAITPANPSTPPRGSIPFSATGGSGTGFKWAIVPNGSGGTIDPTTGAYVAGSKGGTTDSVQVTDSLGNTATTSVTVGPGMSISPPSATVAPLGVVSFSASGGSGAGFSWSMANNSSGGNVVGGAYKAGPVGGGTDVIQVVDSLGNVAMANVAVTAALTIAPTAPSTPPRGSIAFSAMGGAQPYKWSLQTNGSGGNINPNSGQYFAGATGGTTDKVLVTDNNGATASAVVDVTAGITIAPPSPSTPPGGTVDLTAMGGSGTGYAWTITANNSGGMINAATGAYVAGMKAMVSDVVRVTDSLGNTATVSISVGGGIAISPNAPTVPPHGSQAFTATGGSGSGYAWKLTASPSGGTVNASTGAYTAGGTPNVNDVLQVTDSLGNTVSTNISVGAGVAINPASATSAPLGTVHFSASGGSGNGYTYSLTTNASAGKIDATTGVYTAGSIGGGTDTIVVTDSLGNSATATVKLTAALAISPTSASVPPRGGTTFTASGGTGTYAFTLQTNASGGTITPKGVYKAGATPNVVDIVGVADTNGATVTASVMVGAGVSLSPATPSVAPGGKVQFTAMGGSGTGYVWTLSANQSGGGISAGGAYTAGPTGKTVDTVKVTDSLGNSASTSVSVGGGLAINPAMASTSPLGKVTFGAVGGTGGYTFSLGTNASGASIDTTGHYTAGNKGSVTDVVTVTDSSGTTANASVSVGPGITVTPATATVTSGAMVPYAVSGGSGMGYAWAILPNNSGGTIDAKTGVYTAGSLGGVTDTVVAKDSLGNSGTAIVTVKPNPMMGGDGGVDGGGMDGGMPGDGGRMDGGPVGMDGSSGMDGSMESMDGSPGNDSGFEVDGSEFDGGLGAQSPNNGNCGCTIVGVDTSGFGALGGLALGLGLALRRRRRQS